MELYILRHGIAEDGRPGQPDADRELTPKGRQRLAGTLRIAAAADIRPGLIVTSPLVRAVQTAEAAATAFEYEGDLLHSKALVPEADVRDVWTEIRTHREQPSLLLASHNPLCSRLPAYLLGAPDLEVDFRKGGMLCIRFERFGSEPKGTLRWWLGPEFSL